MLWIKKDCCNFKNWLPQQGDTGHLLYIDINAGSQYNNNLAT